MSLCPRCRGLPDESTGRCPECEPLLAPLEPRAAAVRLRAWLSRQRLSQFIAFGPSAPDLDAVLGDYERVNGELASAGVEIRGSRGVHGLAAMAAMQLEDLKTAAGTVTEAIDLLRGFVDEGPCRLDHHGHCQAHGASESDGGCPMVRVRELLARPKGRLEARYRTGAEDRFRAWCEAFGREDAPSQVSVPREDIREMVTVLDQAHDAADRLDRERNRFQAEASYWERMARDLARGADERPPVTADGMTRVARGELPDEEAAVLVDQHDAEVEERVREEIAVRLGELAAEAKYAMYTAAYEHAAQIARGEDDA